MELLYTNIRTWRSKEGACAPEGKCWNKENIFVSRCDSIIWIMYFPSIHTIISK